MKPRIKKIIVVEGRNDESAVKAAVDAEIIVTKGFSISDETWRLMKSAVEGPGILIFTDPDYAGELIRKRIKERFPNSSHAYLTKENAMKKSDIGIENASPENIIKALENAIQPSGGQKQSFTIEDLILFDLTGSMNSAENRDILGNALGIGSCNTKTFLSRLNSYGILREDFYEYGQALFAGSDEGNNK
jgi:ribonuclease M5